MDRRGDERDTIVDVADGVGDVVVQISASPAGHGPIRLPGKCHHRDRRGLPRLNDALHHPAHVGTRRDPAHRLPRGRGRDARARRGGEIHVSGAGGFRRVDLGRAFFSRRAHSESAALEEIEITLHEQSIDGFPGRG